MTRAGWIVVMCGLLVATTFPSNAVLTNPALPSAPAGAEHWLGTDHLGRDVLQRLLGSLATAVKPGLLSAAVAFVWGAALGVATGWCAAWFRTIARGGATCVLSIPPLVWLMLLLMGAGANVWVLGIGVGVVTGTALGVSAGSTILQLKQSDFVLAARGHGVPEGRILGHHLLRLSCGPLLMRGAAEAFAAVTVLDLSLAYLGDLGVAEPTPSLGNMLVGAIESGDPNAWTVLTAAAVALMLVVPATTTPTSVD